MANIGRVFVCSDTGMTALVDEIAALLAARGHEVVRGPIDSPGQRKTYSDSEIDTLFPGVCAAILTPRHICDANLMRRAATLSGICSPVIGVEHIDLAAAAELGLIVGHGAVRGNVVGMAESTIMLILMLLYDVERNVARFRNGLWRRPGHWSRQLEGRTVGLIGFGRIAREMASRLAPFGARVITHSPRSTADSLPAGVKKVELDELLAGSDVVCVLTGLTPETHHLISAERLALMRRDAYLVNTARGAIVDEAAVTVALREGRIAGAALDTFEYEPLAADSPLRSLDNVIGTPHCVGHTIECLEQFAPAAVENVECMLRGEIPPFCKNPDVEPAWRARVRRAERLFGDTEA